MPRKQETTEEKRLRFLKESFEYSNKPRFGFFSIPAPLAISEDRAFSPKPRRTPSEVKPFTVSRPNVPFVLFDRTNEPYQDPLNPFKRKLSFPTDRPMFRVARAISHEPQSAFSTATRPRPKTGTSPAPRGIFTSVSVDRGAFFPYIGEKADAERTKRPATANVGGRGPFRPAGHGLSGGVFSNNEEIFARTVGNTATRPNTAKIRKSDNYPQAPFRPAGGSAPLQFFEYLPETDPATKVARPKTAEGVMPPWRSPPVMPSTNPSPSVALSLSALRPLLSNKPSKNSFCFVLFYKR